MEITLKDLKELLINEDLLKQYTINVNLVKQTIQQDLETLEIWTDGAYKPSTNQGGWSYICSIDQQFGGEKETTNNRMELTAVINALKFFNNNTYSKCIIYSDSQYVINTINNNWKRNKNNDLWEQLDSLISSNIKFVWVKGHDGNEMNEKADKLAVCGSELFIP